MFQFPPLQKRADDVQSDGTIAVSSRCTRDLLGFGHNDGDGHAPWSILRRYWQRAARAAVSGRPVPAATCRDAGPGARRSNRHPPSIRPSMARADRDRHQPADHRSTAGKGCRHAPHKVATCCATANRSLRSGDAGTSCCTGDRTQTCSEAPNEDGPGRRTRHQLRGNGIPHRIPDELVARMVRLAWSAGREVSAIDVRSANILDFCARVEQIHASEIEPDIAIMRWEETA